MFDVGTLRLVDDRRSRGSFITSRHPTAAVRAPTDAERLFVREIKPLLVVEVSPLSRRQADNGSREASTCGVERACFAEVTPRSRCARAREAR